MAHIQSGGENVFDIENAEDARRWLRSWPSIAAEMYQEAKNDPARVAQQKFSRDEYRSKVRTVLSGLESLIRMGTPYIVTPPERLKEVRRDHAASDDPGDLDEDIYDEIACYKDGVVDQLQETAETLRSVLATIGNEQFPADRRDWPLMIAMAGLDGVAALHIGIDPRRHMHLMAAAWEDANFGPIGSLKPSDGLEFRRALRLRLKAWGVLKG